jgi:hypothetical protein
MLCPVFRHVQYRILNFAYNVHLYEHTTCTCSFRCWQLVYALEWFVTTLLSPLSCFPSLSLLRAGLCHHIIIELYR